MLICVNAVLSANAYAESMLIFKAACLSFLASFIGMLYFLMHVLIFERGFLKAKKHLKLCGGGLLTFS